MEDESKFSKMLGYAEQHPYILLGIVVVLIVVIIVMFLHSRGYGMENMGGSKKGRKKKEPLNDDEEIDELIESIHSKQKKKK
ncbi:Hypothetical protein PACV_329 [Pacmanvirus A23]|uniref:Hypothetical protein n=1 Tax=Pacmanvirus A23 TaxID=1932881 RepID=UPI000A091AC0|nr:Hypothetical protein B9W72_gp325 [Pacmanvirus A23]SIP86042.1 Hypothetical protein PACV_329 [Pacmanvirus A23]